jgi:hypothetical protein
MEEAGEKCGGRWKCTTTSGAKRAGSKDGQWKCRPVEKRIDMSLPGVNPFCRSFMKIEPLKYISWGIMV